MTRRARRGVTRNAKRVRNAVGGRVERRHQLVQGDADDVVPPEAVLAWAAEQPRAPRLQVLAGAGHFFHGKLHELKPLLLDFLRA